MVHQDDARTAAVVRRRPVPSLTTFAEFRTAVTHPHATRLLVGMIGAMALVAAIIMAYTVFTILVSGSEVNTLVVVLLAAPLALAVFAVKPLAAAAYRPLYRRAGLGGAVVCDAFPAGLKDLTILVDVQMPEERADALVEALRSRLAAHPDSGEGIVDAERLVGPRGRGGFVTRNDGVDSGWRMLLPATAPADPTAPYRDGLLLMVRQPPG